MSLSSGFTPAALPQSGRSSSALAPSSIPTILVVDDDPSLREMVGIILSSEGYEVQTCRSGNEAIRALRADPLRHRILILDMTMADGNGLDVLTWMAEHAESVQWTRVVVATAQPAPLPEWTGKLVQAVLRKPYGVDALLAIIRQSCSGFSSWAYAS